MKTEKKRSILFRLWPYLKPHTPAIVACFVLSIIINVMELAKPMFIENVIDNYLMVGKADSGIHSILFIGLMYVGCVVVGSIANILQSLQVNRTGQNILMGVRRDVFNHVQRMPMRTLDKYSSGRLITRATNDVEALNELFADVIVPLFQDVVLLAGIVGVMLNKNWQLALVAFIAVPPIVLVTVVVRNKLRRNFTVVKSLIGQINGFFAENISGMRVVQVFRREIEKLREFDKLNNAYFKAALTQVRMNTTMRPLMEVINTLGIALLIWYGAGRISMGILEVGTLYLFTDYIKRFFDPINDIAEMYTTIQSASVSSERIFELLDDDDGLEDVNKGRALKGRAKGRIEFEHVWFAYNGEDWVLRDVSFTIEPGQSAAFVGQTGAGKTTIISLITRFYDIQRGRILLDGQDIREIKLADLRRNVSVVLQDVFLFSGTIAENVRLNDSYIDDVHVDQALKLACAQPFIDKLPGKMEEPVTERGSTFSAGQRQLISFSRAIAHNPAVFVLDEATANIDTETELLIQQSIENVSAGRTTIIIAHRLSTIRNCDMIFVMQKGLIAERGNHEELLEQNGIYARLHRAQFFDNNKALEGAN